MLNFKKDIWSIIQNEPVSSVVTDSGLKILSSHFKPLSPQALNVINAKIENEMKTQAVFGSRKDKKELISYTDLKKKASMLGNLLLTNYKTGQSLLTTVDSFLYRDITPSMDFNFGNNLLNSNIWISPAEAAQIYSGKGIPELIIEKKSHSPLLNGIKIKNPKLEPKELDKLAEDIIRYQFDIKIAEAIRDSLVFGGALFFPMFKKDNPVTMTMSIEGLLKYGVLGKDCIDRFITLDRWNVVFTPDWNPLSATFQKPDSYFIPFLGSVINGQRCSRIVTSPPAGYWGVLMTLGWGVSDIPGWIEAVLNYDSVMQAIPFMIKQMSLLARTFDTSGMSAMEGAAMLDLISEQQTFRNRGTGPDNIINIDTIGELKAISRDFTEVPQLVRLLRQDIAARARYPEELIWSSERPAFVSGDNGDSAFEKQTENIRYTHLKVARQLKEIVMIFVINSLGVSQRILNALPYTVIEFDNPRLSNAKDRSEIAAKIGRGIFDSVASGIPVPIAINMAQQLSDNEFNLTSELMEQIEQRQKENDEFNNKKRELELLSLEVELEQKKRSITEMNSGVIKSGKKSEDLEFEEETEGIKQKKGHSYEDPLEQRKHEKVGEHRGQIAQKRRENKKDVDNRNIG